MTGTEAFLFDLGWEIKSRAREAVKAREREARDSAARHFQSGRAIAFAEVISIMQQNAKGLGIPLSALRLDDIDPDNELV